MKALDVDRRKNPRYEYEQSCFIETVSASQLSNCNFNQQQACSVDLSREGLQVFLDFEVLIDAEIVLWIDASPAVKKMLIGGHVKWVKAASDRAGFLVGVQLNPDSLVEMNALLAQLNKKAD
jgi:hypothetical protein